MARGDPDGGYFHETFIGGDVKELAEYLDRQLLKISTAFDTARARKVEFLNAAPSKPREGFLYGADGTNWNPGGGQGVYCYYNSGWHYLG